MNGEYPKAWILKGHRNKGWANSIFDKFKFILGKRRTEGSTPREILCKIVIGIWPSDKQSQIRNLSN